MIEKVELTLGIVLKVLDQDVLHRGRLEGQDQAVTDKFRGQGESLLRQILNELKLDSLPASLHVIVADIQHEELGLQVRNGHATWGCLLGPQTSQPKVEDRGQGEHGHGGVSLATLHEGLLPVAENCEDVGDHRG